MITIKGNCEGKEDTRSRRYSSNHT